MNKVIHIVESLHRGAVENWLARMLRYGMSSGKPLDWTFYCALGEKGRLDEEARSLGAKVVYSPVPIHEKWEFMRALRHELKKGAYEVMHCHHDLVSALYLCASIGLPIERKLVHVHNADEAVLTPNRIKAALLRPLARMACLALADRIVGISNHTLDTFIASRARRQGEDLVHYYGIDSSPFEGIASNRSRFRRELGLQDDALVLLFASRMVDEKNPLFAVDVLAEMRRMDERVAGVFVGAGRLEEAVCRRADEQGIGSHFRHLGWRDDIAEIMSCCDWFILPRPEKPMEGLGIAVIEAQLSGIRMLLSRGIADDPLLPEAVYRRLSLALGPEKWARAAMELLDESSPDRELMASSLKASPFSMEFAFSDLLALHK